jgi:transcription elongation factor GreA
MNKEAIDAIIEKNPLLVHARHKLEAMQVGAYCLHRSWGFGKIIEYDAAQDRLIIDFEDGRDGHAMAPAFCVDKLEILADSDILVRSRLDKASVETQMKKEPVEIIVAILDQTEGKMMVGSEIERVLVRLMGPIKAKKWWTNTKKLLQKDPRIGVPAKKTEAFVLRDEPIKPEDEILELFHQTKNPKEKILLGDKLYSLSENISVIREELPEILKVLTEAIQSTKSLAPADRLHGVWVRNNLARELHEDVETLEPSSGSILHDTNDFSELADELPSQYQKRYLDLIRRTFPDKWEHMLEDLLRNSNGKFTTECINFMLQHGMDGRISKCLKRWLNEQTIKAPVLLWVIKSRHSKKFSPIIQPLMSPRILNSIFYAIDYEALQNAGARRIPLADLLGEDVELIPELLADADFETARDLAQTLLLNQGFEDLSKKSLLARFIKLYPAIQSLVAGDASTAKRADDEALIVSAESFERMKKEYEELISTKIPENKEAIAIAREHGDLKENSEYKMARQDQDTLLARKNQLELDLGRARVTDFTEVGTDTVAIGSTVTLKEGSTGKTSKFHILGAWDSDPDNSILSYKTPLAQQLLGKSVGNVVETEIGGRTEEWTILGLARWVDRG